MFLYLLTLVNLFKSSRWQLAKKQQEETRFLGLYTLDASTHGDTSLASTDKLNKRLKKNEQLLQYRKLKRRYSILHKTGYRNSNTCV